MDNFNKSMVSHKIKTREKLLEKIGSFPREKKVVMCHGTFDVVHPGHIRHLMYAKSKGDVLVVSITGDKHIKKDAYRPYVPQELREINLAALEVVDYVIVDGDETPIKNLRAIKPDYFAKGFEYIKDEVHPKTQEEIEVIESYGGEVLFSPGDFVRSSSALINIEPPAIEVERVMMLMGEENITFDTLRKTVESLKDIKVHVVGDTIVDSYTYCTPIGGGTKTPTMSLRYDKKDDYVGGAAIVAKHIKSAGAKVVFSTVLGQDDFAKMVLDDLRQSNIDTLDIIDKTRPTTNKNAIIAGGYRLLKVDTVDNRSISDKILHLIESNIKSTECDIIVFSDFRHGIFSKNSIETLVKSIPESVFKVADSQVASRWGNIVDFKNFDLITPNEREARFSMGDQDSVVRDLAFNIKNMSKCKNLILKLGERGLIMCRDLPPEDHRSLFSVGNFTDHVSDAVGSGDALLSYACLALYATKNEAIAAILGSLAAAVECEYDGNIPVTPKDILKKIDYLEGKVRFDARK